MNIQKERQMTITDLIAMLDVKPKERHAYEIEGQLGREPPFVHSNALQLCDDIGGAKCDFDVVKMCRKIHPRSNGKTLGKL